MTVAALRRLLADIDRQGGPDAARQNRLHLPDPQEGPQPMATAPAPVIAAADVRLKAAPEPPAVSVGQLLKWGDDHQDADVRDQAARARMLLGSLRARHAADAELTAITSEAEQLEARLAELRAREQELTPAKKKKAGRRSAPSYDAKAVRVWAREQGVDCPPVARVPKAVLEQWRTATGTPTA